MISAADTTKWLVKKLITALSQVRFDHFYVVVILCRQSL